jgi:glycosyltransferase involved in cell wall biosynthesis
MEEKIRRILLCAYSFPPISGPQSLRWLNFVRRLKEYEFHVLTITPSKGYGRYSLELLKEVTPNVHIFRTYPGLIHRITYQKRYTEYTTQIDKNQELGVFELLRNFYRYSSYLLIPDRMVEWIPFALYEGKKLLKDYEYDLIISSAFPFSSHIVAYFLKKWSHLPWIADYGDPWSILSSNPMDSYIERRILRNIDRVIVTTDEAKSGYLHFYPFLEDNKVTVISQGFDEERYKKIEPVTFDTFTIVFTGNLSYSARDPKKFFNALKRIKNDINVIITGSPSINIINYVRELGLENKVKFTGIVSQEEIVALQKGASVLLSFGWKGNYQVPGKIFEYMAAKRPILHVIYDENDVGARIITSYNKGIVVRNEHRDIYESIEKLISCWKKRDCEYYFNLSIPENFSWMNQCRKLKELIEEVC